ncbi:cysteine hydrolase family protein [Aeromicrobium sp. 179-A 4D2 NHS]|uniref:cysteine hydrolase family protein n=1 Tax=Aeromicrobium sp. 179-A 4D2 NHS TaxID=3142375 RepID=UPI0039A01A86
MSEPWLVVIDPQRVFAATDSPWGSPMFGAIVEPVRDLAARHRTIVTRWVPEAADRRTGSWRAYFETWPFADQPADDPLFDLVPEVADLAADGTVDATTFGKWPALERVTGPAPELVLAGVSTDCCVISTALAAADAGATVTVVAAACAGSTPENHAKALDVMALYAPQVTVV